MYPAWLLGAVFLVQLFIPVPGSTEESCGRIRNNMLIHYQSYLTNDYPMLVALAMMRDDKLYKFCQGTIISKRMVLTTHRCYIFPNNTYVVVGPHDSKGSGTNFVLPYLLIDVQNSEQLYNVSRFIEYQPEAGEQYDTQYTRNIPLMLILDKDLTFNHDVGPACLPFELPDSEITNVNMIGWGFHQENLEDILYFDFTVEPLEKCIEIYGNWSNQMCMTPKQPYVSDKPGDGSAVYYTGKDGKVYIVGLEDTYERTYNITAWNALSVKSIKDLIKSEYPSKSDGEKRID